MKPEPARFTKDNPCSKKHIHNCFATPTGYVPVPVVDAQAEIGLNVPRVMERAGRLKRTNNRGVDYYELTAEGKKWLVAGIKAYVKNHPLEAKHVLHMETEPAPSGRIRRIVRG